MRIERVLPKTVVAIVRSYTCEPNRALVPDGNGSMEAYYTCPHRAKTTCSFRGGEACNNQEQYAETTRALYRAIPFLEVGQFEAPVGQPVLRTRVRSSLITLTDALRP